MIHRVSLLCWVGAGLKRACAVFLIASAALAQAPSLRGRVTDETGAVIPGARIELNGPAGPLRTMTNGEGAYAFPRLPPGDYIVTASAPDLVLREPAGISLKQGVRTLDLELAVVAAGHKVTVEDLTGPSVSADASSNASALVLRGNDLDALADNPDDLASDLQALAGPSAGPNGGAIFIDGFSGGQLPPKESIREIRINQNPFSPDYDKLGLGRIEIFTKPGSDKFKGLGYYNFADDFWNSRNPFAARKAPFLLKEYGGSLSKTFAFGRGEGRDAPSNIPGGGLQRRDNAGVFTTGTAQAAPARTNLRYNIIVSMSVRNVLNHTNPGPIIGNITSPLFGQANQPAGSSSLGGTGFSEAANNRRLELQTRFKF